MADVFAAGTILGGSGTIGQNAKVSKNPFSKFGTRELSLLKVTGLTGVHTNAEVSNSLYNKALAGVQTLGEVFFARAATDVLYVFVATDTLPTADSKTGSTESGDGYGLFEAAIDAATGGSSTVAAATLS